MAHEVETMAYAGEVPWHGLGVPVSNDLTVYQMMDKANLNWKVHEVPNYVDWEGQRVNTTFKSLIRETDGRILTTVGKDWNPVQNEEAFKFFEEYVNVGDMEMHTAGSLKDGQYVWALAKVKDSFELFSGDKVDSYLLFSNPHVYGKSIDIRFTPIRVVCNNTLTLSLSGKNNKAVKIRHRTKFNAEQVKETLGIATEELQKYKEVAQYLGSTRIKDVETLIHYYNDVYPRDEKHGTTPLKEETLSKPAKVALKNFDTQPGAKFAEGSWWQAFNSVTYSQDHVYGKNKDNRLYNSWFGRGQVLKKKALDKALAFADAA